MSTDNSSNSEVKASSLPKIISCLKCSIESFISKGIEKAGVKGLVISHGNILVQLYKEDKQTMAKIAQDISRCKGTLTVLVNKLEKVGFITREADSEDTRVKKLCLTDEGKKFQKDFWEISNDLSETLWKGFSHKEQEECISFLNRMTKNMTESLADMNSKK